MRHILTILCEDAQLSATLDEAAGAAGLLIVQGGNETRIGAHRGMARLAAAVARAGHPVLRFDRRGVGDSEGTNGGYASSGPDIAAAVEAFRDACPALTRVVAFGNCDAATALVVHRGDARIDALILSNPWIAERPDALPPPAAIKGHYVRRLRDPAAWAALLTGKIDVRGLAKGLGRIIAPGPPGPLPERFADALRATPLPATLVIAEGDGTALSFRELWLGPVFEDLRASIALRSIDSRSHSYADDGDFDALLAIVLAALR